MTTGVELGCGAGRKLTRRHSRSTHDTRCRVVHTSHGQYLRDAFFIPRVLSMGYAYPQGYTISFPGLRGELAEAKVACNGAIMLSLCVVHEGENVFL